MYLVRLGVALNFQVFYYEFLDIPDLVLYLAKQAFDDAIAQLVALTEECYKHLTSVKKVFARYGNGRVV